MVYYEVAKNRPKNGIAGFLKVLLWCMSDTLPHGLSEGVIMVYDQVTKNHLKIVGY